MPSRYLPLSNMLCPQTTNPTNTLGGEAGLIERVICLVCRARLHLEAPCFDMLALWRKNTVKPVHDAVLNQEHRKLWLFGVKQLGNLLAVLRNSDNTFPRVYVLHALYQLVGIRHAEPTEYRILSVLQLSACWLAQGSELQTSG